MGFTGFVVWFIAGLVAMFFLEITIENPFILSLLVGLALGFLGGIKE